MKRLLMIVNPNAGNSRIKVRLADILDIFIKAGYRAEVYITQRPGDAARMANMRGRHADLVVCSGGDGTLNETINGLMRIPAEKRPELGYISAGTTNDFAHSLKLPSRLLDAARTAASGEPFAIDIGRINRDYFCYVAGFGAFTDVSYVTPQEVKKVLGHQAYLLEAAKQLMKLKPEKVRCEADGQVYEGDFLCGLVSNTYRVGGMTGIWGRDIQLDEGLFEVTLIRQPTNLIEWGDLANAVFNQEAESAFLIQFKAQRIIFVSEEPIDWVRDGEFGGSLTNVEIENLRQAVTIHRKAPKQ